MAKIILNNKEFNIDDAVIALINEGLKNHLLTTMAGEGATITLDGVTYNIDATKLATAKNNFVAHLGTIAGEGAKVVVGGVEYVVDATKIGGAMSELGTAFGELENGGSGDSDSVVGTWMFNETPNFEGVDFYFDFTAYSFANESWVTHNNLYDDGGGAMLYEGDYTSEVAFADGQWTADNYKTINIITEPTDLEFIAWLKTNAVKIKLENVVGAWVFNDEVTIPSELYDKNIYVNFTSNNTEGDKAIFNTMYFWDDGSGLSYYGDTDGIEEPYYIDNGWSYGCEVITILEQPTDPDFIAWLKANAVKIEFEDVVGTWVFNETIKMPSKNFEVIFISDGKEYVAIELSGGILYYSVEVGDETDPVYSDEFSWEQGETHKTITITEQSTDPEFIAWLKANATKLDDSIIGTWKFNDEIISFLQVVDTQEKYDDWCNNSTNLYSLKGYSMVDGERREFSEFYCLKIVGTFTGGEFNYCTLGDADDFCFYYEDGSWDICQPITITEEPSPEIAAWLQTNAVKVEDDNNIVNKNGYLFSTINDVNYLIGYEGDDTELVLPSDYNGENYQINNIAFQNYTSLTSIAIPDSVISIGNDAFCGCTSLASVEIPDSVTSIGERAFYLCLSLTSITIPDSVTSIGVSVFNTCTSLASVEIPDLVTSIGGRAFYLCSSLTSISFGGTMAQWNSITKGEDWNFNVPAIYVQCSDGQVTL